MIASVTTAIAERSITPLTSRTAVRLEQQQMQCSPRRRPCRQAEREATGSSRQQTRWRAFQPPSSIPFATATDLPHPTNPDGTTSIKGTGQNIFYFFAGDLGPGRPPALLLLDGRTTELIDATFHATASIGARVSLLSGDLRFLPSTVDAGFAHEFAIGDFCSAPVDCADLSGRVFILAPGPFTPGLLHLSEIVANKIAAELEQFALRSALSMAAIVRCGSKMSSTSKVPPLSHVRCVAKASP